MKTLSPSDYQYPVLFFANGIGDHLMVLPTVRALARVFEGRLTLIGSSRLTDVFFEDIPDLGRLVAADFYLREGYRIFEADVVADQVGDCDLFISLNPSFSASMPRLLERLQPKLSIGFFPQYDLHVPLDFGKHSADLDWDMVRLFAPEWSYRDFSAPLSIPDSFLQKAKNLSSMLPPEAKTLALHLDTGDGKMWDPHKAGELLERLWARFPDLYVFLLGIEKQDLGLDPLPDRLFPCYGMPLSLSFALLRQCDVFLGVDSCMLHAADLDGVPALGLFGPTDPEEFGFFFSEGQTLRASGQNMEQLSVDEVEKALLGLLQPVLV